MPQAAKPARCRKKAPFICPECKREDCNTDHWDAPMGQFSLCCFCGKRRRAQSERASKDTCGSDSYKDHQPRCKKKAGHRPPCRGAA